MKRRSELTSSKECTPRFHSECGSLPSRFSEISPMRVMILMLSTTYLESVISHPTLVMGQSAEPMRQGMTNIVRPCIAPFNSRGSLAYVSRGSDQLFVGPASSLVGLPL